MADDIKISQVTNLTESMLMDCYYIASGSQPNMADVFYYVLQDDVNNRGHIMFVARKDVDIIGFIAGHMLANTGKNRETKIDWLFVNARYQRLGIGAKLIAAYEKYCCDVYGSQKVSLFRVQTMQAKNFYTNMGYKQIPNTLKCCKDLGR